jgi:hypothetical protein
LGSQKSRIWHVGEHSSDFENLHRKIAGEEQEIAQRFWFDIRVVWVSDKAKVADKVAALASNA